MRVFITGASGFIGRHVVSRLAGRDHDLLLLSRNERSRHRLSEDTVQTVTGNLNTVDSYRDALVAFNPEVCIHLAWQSIPDYSVGTSKQNLDAATNLVSLLADHTDCRKLLISGSCYEYGHAHGPCRESDSGETVSYFAWAKKALHAFCRFVGTQTPLELFWFRIFYVYGPGQRPAALVPSLTAAFKQGKPPQLRSPLDAHDFVYVGDVANAFCKAATQTAAPGVYNLGTGFSTRVIDLCQEVETIVHGHATMTNMLRNGERTEQKTNFWADTTQVQQVLGWRAGTSVREGIGQYLRALATS